MFSVASRGLALLAGGIGTLLIGYLDPSSNLFVSGHGHLLTPRSRNWFAYEAGRDDPTNAPPGLPPREYCSHCINAKLATDTCGRGSAQSYDPNPVDGWLDTYGNPMPWISQATYVEGQEILVGIELTTNHAGHAEVRACPIPDGDDPPVATQECFDANPLEFVRDVCYGGPVDDVYPVRGYFSNHVMHHFIYKLPDGLKGNRVLLQWRYITANSCIPPGYKDEERLGLDALGWLRGFSMADCNVDDSTIPQLVLDPTGSRGPGDPEQFWNCAEVTVLPADGSNNPGPHPAGTEICDGTPPPPTSNPPPTPPSPTNWNPTTSSPVGPPNNSEGYCNWGPLGTALSSSCDGCVQGGEDCNGGAHQCESDCGGRWCTNVAAISPTCSYVPSPTPPTPSPPTNTNYCGTSWMNAKDSSCQPLVEGGGLKDTATPCADGNSTACGSGEHCYADILCEYPPPPPGPPPPAPTPPAPTPPTPPGTLSASTTRYWDCSGGACGCAYLPGGAGTDSNPAHCHSNAMFQAPAGNEYGAAFYGAAAISRFLWDGNTNSGDWMGEGCGKCWKVTGSSNTGPNVGTETTVVLKGTNICPTGICNENGKAHFDIAAPGFDVLEYSWSNTCETLEADEIEGFESCGRWMIDNQDPTLGCDCSKFNSPVLRAGCENFYSLMWDNPSVVYEEVACPSILDTLPCWEENGNGYPQDGIPETCMDPNGDPQVVLPFPGSPPAPPTPPSPTTGPPPPAPTPPTPTPPTPPGTLSASTTRYWDCSGGACGCAYLPGGAGTDSNPAHCHSNAMFQAPAGNEYGAAFYGAAAISRFLWDGNTNSGDWMGEGCGKCWKVTGSSNTGPNVGTETTVVLKGTNICPTGICNENGKAHFDIAAPGFDVLEYSWSNTCETLEADEIEGFESCGRWMIDNQDPTLGCDCSKFNSPVLRAGCENFYSLMWDNPSVVYEEVACPSILDTLPCWEENGNGYPQDGIPETCMDPNGDPQVVLPFPGSPPAPPTPPSPTTGPPPPAPTPPAPTPNSFPPIVCPEGFETARWTWYISYPKCCEDQPHYDPLAPTDECTMYNGCAWDGDFAYVGNRPFNYVQNTDIVAFFASSGETFPKKIIRVYSPIHDKTVDSIVLDTCGDLDCNGCCTENANTGGGYLVDMEENTIIRHFGSLGEANGLVCWQILPDEEYDAGGYCNWSGCNGAAQGGWDCNLNEYECETTCAGEWCPTSPPAPTPPAPTPPVSNPTTISPVVPPTTDAPIKSPTGPPVANPTTGSPVVLPTTAAPIEPPTTNAPVTPPTTEAPAPPTSGGDPCCTWDLKNCSLDPWCNVSESNCKSGCGAPFWADVSLCPASGIAKGYDCTNNPNCCPGLHCKEHSQWYHSCEVPPS